MKKFFARSWAVVDLDILQNNVRILRRLFPNDCHFLAVIKAEGYGLGMLPTAQACIRGGADWFGVATVKEALQLREAGITLPILVLGVTPPEWAEELGEYQLSQVVPSLDYAEAMSQRAMKNGRQLSVHIKIDTGMGRLGWYASPETLWEIQKDVLRLARLPGLRTEGILTHLPVSRDPSEEAVTFTRKQLEIFSQLCANLELAGLTIPFHHALNSGGILNYREYALDMVRAGHILYENIAPIIPQQNLRDIRCTIEIKTTISFIHTVPQGTTVGYGRTWYATRPTRVAVLGLGYCDGYPSALSNSGSALLHGRRGPVIGRVCMDQMMIDVTDVRQAQEGDIVTIVGKDGEQELTMNDVLQQANGMINAPISSCLTNRIERYYRKGGKIIAGGEGCMVYNDPAGRSLLRQ